MSTPHVLRIEHPVPSYDTWKAAFDSDPVGRAEGGVRAYRIMRAADDPDYVLVDLEFDDSARAQAFLESLHELWGRVEVMHDPVARVVRVTEDETL